VIYHGNTLGHLTNRIAGWVRSRLGEKALMDRQERAARLVEEAIELAQAEGVPEIRIVNVARRVYDRPVGEVEQEIGGIGVCLLAYCHASGFNFVTLTDREVTRIEKVPVEVSRAKHNAKVRAGTAMKLDE
jgi:hypothetical protein